MIGASTDWAIASCAAAHLAMAAVSWNHASAAFRKAAT